MCAHTSKQASYFAVVVCLYDYILFLPTITPSSFLFPYIHHYMQRIVRAPIVLLALLLASAFSLHILLLLQSLFAITYTADGDEHTHTYTKQSKAPCAHTRPLQRVCSTFEKEARRERRDIHIYIYTHTYIYTSCVCVFSRCRFFLLARQQRETTLHWLTDWLGHISLSLSLSLFVFNSVVHSFIWQSLSREVREKERQRAMIVFIR